MFYTQLFMSKRGTLAKIWLAAHWEKKITKSQVFECNLESTVKDIISPQITIGLRTSGHLLLGVVRIYFRKAKYLLADCSDAIVKINVAFRPGQTDLPSENQEAALKAITLREDFVDFESQLPDLSDIDVADHFNLNQCRTEEITLKENYKGSFLGLELSTDFGDEAHLHQGGLFDGSFHSLATHGDGFGDEDAGFNLLDFIASSGEDALPLDFSPGDSHNEVPPTPPPTALQTEGGLEMASCTEVEPEEAPTLNETTLLENEDEEFALEPVAVTPSSEMKRGKRKRRLLVDREKELSNEAIRQQIANTSDLLAPLDMAPPTRQLAAWKEVGGVHWLFRHFSAPPINPHLHQLFPRDMISAGRGTDRGSEDPEDMRNQRDEDRERSELAIGDPSFLLDAVESSGRSLDPTPLSPIAEERPTTSSWDSENVGTEIEITLPNMPSEDSLLVHPSGLEREIPVTQTQTQPTLDSQDFEENRINSRAHNLLQLLKMQNQSGNTLFSLYEMCDRSCRRQAAATFYCFLVLKKQNALELHQSAPYADIIATPGPRFQQH